MRDELTGVEVWPVYDRQRSDFYGAVGNEVVRAERASDLFRKLREAMRRGFGLRWERAIVVERGADMPKFLARAVHRDGFHAGVALGVVRGEIATRARDGATLFRAWPPEDIDPDLPEGINPPDLRIVSVLPAHVLVRPYTEASWRGVLAAMLVLERARAAIDAASTVDALAKAVDLRTLLAEVRAAEARPREE